MAAHWRAAAIVVDGDDTEPLDEIKFARRADAIAAIEQHQSVVFRAGGDPYRDALRDVAEALASEGFHLPDPASAADIVAGVRAHFEPSDDRYLDALRDVASELRDHGVEVGEPETSADLVAEMVHPSFDWKCDDEWRRGVCKTPAGELRVAVVAPDRTDSEVTVDFELSAEHRLWVIHQARFAGRGPMAAVAAELAQRSTVVDGRGGSDAE